MTTPNTSMNSARNANTGIYELLKIWFIRDTILDELCPADVNNFLSATVIGIEKKKWIWYVNPIRSIIQHKFWLTEMSGAGVTFTREFPRELEFLLPLRMSARRYSEDRGVVTIFNESPETDENQRVSGEMYAMTVRPAFQGHAVYVKPDENSMGFMQVCEPVYDHLYANKMGEAIKIVTEGSLKWINRFKGMDTKPIRPQRRQSMSVAHSDSPESRDGRDETLSQFL
jgi:hypothetical protein